MGEEADTLRHTLAELGVRISRDQVRCWMGNGHDVLLCIDVSDVI